MSDDLITRAEEWLTEVFDPEPVRYIGARGITRELVAALKEAHARTGHLAEEVVALEDALKAAQAELERIRKLAESWQVDDDTYLHLDGQDLGYADAAVLILHPADKTAS